MCKVFIRDPSRRTVQLLFFFFEADDEQLDWNRILKISKAQSEFNSTIMMALSISSFPCYLFIHLLPNGQVSHPGSSAWALCYKKQSRKVVLCCIPKKLKQ